MRNTTQSKLIFWSGMIGNTLDHYDVALYMFLVPIMAPVFFPDAQLVVSLKAAFYVNLTYIISKPLGAFIFGNLALKYPIKNLLTITLVGVGLSTFCIGIIPDYQSIGIMAPYLLIFIRIIQGIFAAGEYSIATIFVLEQVKEKSEISRNSTVFLFSTMCGSMLASFAATLVSKSSDPSTYWRYAYLAGVVTTLLGIILRLMVKYPEQQVMPTPQRAKSTLKLVFIHRIKIYKIIIISSFSWLTYLIPFIFLNSFIPLISAVKTGDLLLHTTILLVVNNACIPILMLIIDKFNIIKWMAWMSGLFSITIVPVFLSLPYLDITGINIVKLWIIVLGVCFSATFNALIFKMSEGPERYLITGFGYSLGSEILGRNAPAICLNLWQYFDNLLAPALYLLFISCLTTYILIKEHRKLFLISALSKQNYGPNIYKY